MGRVRLRHRFRGPPLSRIRSGESWFLIRLPLHRLQPLRPAEQHDPRLLALLFPGGNPHRTLHEGVYTARSRHPGGVNALLMDGSVRFVRDGVNLAVWRALATRAAGDVVSSDSY